jgi:hypothetical protein
LAPAQESQAPAIRTGIKDQIQKITAVLVDYDAKIDGNNKQIAEISKRADLSDADRKKIEQLDDSSEKAKLEILNVRSNLEEVRAALGAQGDDIGELKKSLDRLVTERGKLAPIKEVVERLANAPEEFKAFTDIRMELNDGGKGWLITLVGVKGGKKIPLAHRTVRVSRQFLDGEPKEQQKVVTDENGQAPISRGDWRKVPKGHNLRVDFDGDKDYRPSGYDSRHT